MANWANRCFFLYHVEPIMIIIMWLRLQKRSELTSYHELSSAIIDCQLAVKKSKWSNSVRIWSKSGPNLTNFRVTGNILHRCQSGPDFHQIWKGLDKAWTFKISWIWPNDQYHKATSTPRAEPSWTFPCRWRQAPWADKPSWAEPFPTPKKVVVMFSWRAVADWTAIRTASRKGVVQIY